MACRYLSLACTLGAASAALAESRSAVTPVQKVIQMMESMLAKGKQEKQDEQVQFAAYRQFCGDTTAAKEVAIKEATEQIQVLSADIEVYDSTAKKMTQEIAEHEEDISVWTGDNKAATKVRQIEQADFEALHKDYSESVDALERAITVLKEQLPDRKQAEPALMQVKGLNLMPQKLKAMVDAFLQDEQTPPEAHGYESRSGGIVAMLQQLHEEFIAERTALEKEEMNAVHAFEMLTADLAAQISQAQRDRDEKTESKAKALEAKATAEGDLKDTSATKDADQTYLADLTATCEQKASDFEARQQLRQEEIEAVSKAIEIVSSSQVQGAAEKNLPSLVQRARSGRALVSVFMGRSQAVDVQSAVKFLQQKSQELSSPVLLSIAGRMTGPLDKVTQMIKDLIVRLLEEANNEAEHKGWCDKELATNEHTRKEKADAVETLTAEIDGLEASVAKLTEDVAQLSKEIAELDQAVAEATKLREEERAKHATAVEEAVAAQAAVQQALTVLRDFYAKAGQATAFVQRKKQQPEAPEIFSSPYRGMGGESGGIIGMLEVIASDFARLETDTKTAEATSQKEYDTFMSDSKVDKASKETDIEHKTARKQDEEQALVTKHEDLVGNQKELDAAMAYFDKLKPSCVDAGVSYEDRVARRKEEIQSLKEALDILNGKDIV